MDNLKTDIINAYIDASRSNLRGRTVVEFQRHFSENIIKIYKEIVNRTYRHGRCTAFFVHRPVTREIFAPGFKDRIVQRLLFNYLYNYYDNKFIYDSYAGRKNKGVSFGIKRLQHHIRSCSQNYQSKATWILKLDIKSFFCSIDQKLLYEIVTKDIINSNRFNDNLPIILYLLKTIIFFNPTKNCYKKGSTEDWNKYPKHKSQFNAQNYKGIPIGSIMSLLLANILLHNLDIYIKRELKFKHYGRYVDDFYIVDNDKEKLLKSIEKIKLFLNEKLQLTLHPNKITIREAKQGITFLGSFILPYGTFPDKKTLKIAKKRYNEIYHENMNIYKIQMSLASYKTILGEKTIL